MHLKLLQNSRLGYLISNEILDRITQVSETSPKNNSKTNEEEIFRLGFIPSQLRRKIIDDLRWKVENYGLCNLNKIIIQ